MAAAAAGSLGNASSPARKRAIGACDVRYRVAATNKGPWNGARGYGRPAHRPLPRDATVSDAPACA